MRKVWLVVSSLWAFQVGHAAEYSFPDPYPQIYETTPILPYFMHGWFRHEREFEPLLAEGKIKTVIEVGVFLGNLTAYIAPRLPNGSRYFAIDHFKGSPEFYPGTFEFECTKTMFQQFISNMVHKHLTDKVIPVRMNSVDAAKKFQELGIFGDVIYIDASHDDISVYQDIVAWYPCLAPGGVFCGDDWYHGGVKLAVQQFAEQNNLSIYAYGNFWKFISK